MDTLTWATASKNAQRLLQKTSGPFDKELTDVTDALVASVESDTIAMTTDESKATTISQEDLYNLIRTEGESLLEKDGLRESFDLYLEDNNNFMEEFVDLSDILLGNDTGMDTSPVDDNQSESPSTSTSGATVSGKKRKSAEDLDSSFSVPADHSGYTTKNKRARHCSSVSVASETDSEIGSTVEMSRDEKYVQRRQKNNVASKRSRETRKQKYVNIEQQSIDLETANAELRHKVTELEALAEEMKRILIQRMVAK